MRLTAVLLLMAAWTAPARAQVYTGRIDVRVLDQTGGALAGATVTVGGPQPQTATTDAEGRAHLLSLAPGVYTLRATAPGFSDYFNPAITVAAGTSVPLGISMMVQGVATQVQVTRVVPLIDARKLTVATNLGADDLQSVPSARDPWVVLQTIAGVAVDRVNVGGAESGQQSTYMAKGAAVGDNTWSLDGIPITDMAATGASPAYYDFDALQEAQAVTGGADVQSATPGVQLNLVLKSGSDSPHGSGRLYFENESLQANNMPADLASTIGGATGKGNRTHRYDDYGVELGGPIVKGRLWGWGAAAKTHVDLLTLNNAHDRTDLQNDAVKLTGQATPSLRAGFTYFRSNKEKFGRGAAPNRATETTYDQTGPSSVYKAEGNYAGRSLFVSAKAAHVTAGFTLTPKGGTSASVWEDDGGIFHGSFDVYATRRPQDSAAIDANTFHGSHELKFGFSWRRAEVASTDGFPGSGIVTYHVGYPAMLGQVTRDNSVLATTTYASAYAGDTWTRGPLTAAAGVRWDRQASSLGAAAVPASRALPSVLPSVTAAPVANAIVWSAVTPRLGVTWTPGRQRKTLVRAAYSMFASQLGATAAGFISPIQPATITFEAIDLNGNKIADPDELRTGSVAGFSGFDPFDPRRAAPRNRIGGYKTPITHEVIAGGEYELWPHFVLGADVTYRYMAHQVWAPPVGVTAADYIGTGTLTGHADPIGEFSVPLYSLLASNLPAGDGQVYEERKGYHQRFIGFELNAVRRLAQGWTLRAAFSTNDHREYFGGTDGLLDPTPGPASPSRHGGLVVTEAIGSGKSNVFMILPSYQIVATGMYQARWGINLAASLLIRQGYATPFFAGATRTGDPNGQPPTVPELKDVLVVDDVGRYRLPAPKSLDARVEKVFAFPRATLAADLDIFNALNSATPLGRQYDLRLTGPTGFDRVLEIMNPLIVRLGIRASF